MALRALEEIASITRVAPSRDEFRDADFDLVVTVCDSPRECPSGCEKANACIELRGSVQRQDGRSEDDGLSGGRDSIAREIPELLKQARTQI